MKWLKILLDLRSAWKSKTLTLARVLTFIPVIDLSFFSGEAGGRLVTFVADLVHKAPWWSMVSNEQVALFLVATVGAAVAWLRTVTTQPIETKL